MLLTIRQAAERMNVCKKTIYRRIKSGELRAVRLAEKSLRIDEADLNAYIEKLKSA